MGVPERKPSADAAPSSEDVAGAAINRSIEDAVEAGPLSRSALASRLASEALHMRREHAGLVFTYIAAMRGIGHSSVIDVLPDGVGGQWNGSVITVAPCVMEVGEGGVSEAIAHIRETEAHEYYHAMHGHTQRMVTAGEGPTSVVIAGEGFTTTEFIEGFTVVRTGREFVSAEYRRFADRLQQCLSLGGLGVADVEEAIEHRNLTEVDDRAREEVGVLEA